MVRFNSIIDRSLSVYLQCFVFHYRNGKFRVDRFQMPFVFAAYDPIYQVSVLTFSSLCGMLRRSRCVQIFLQTHRYMPPFETWKKLYASVILAPLFLCLHSRGRNASAGVGYRLEYREITVPVSLLVLCIPRDRVPILI